MNCLVNKGNIHYEMAGSGFPIIIMHSMGSDHRSMMTWIEPIFENIHGFQRIYIDLPAHGQSSIDEDFKSSDDLFMENRLIHCNEKNYSVEGIVSY